MEPTVAQLKLNTAPPDKRDVYTWSERIDRRLTDDDLNDLEQGIFAFIRAKLAAFRKEKTLHEAQLGFAAKHLQGKDVQLLQILVDASFAFVSRSYDEAQKFYENLGQTALTRQPIALEFALVAATGQLSLMTRRNATWAEFQALPIGLELADHLGGYIPWRVLEAKLLLKLNRVDEALDQLSSLRRQPRGVHNLLGVCEMQNSKRDTAIERHHCLQTAKQHFEAALQLDAEWPQLYLNLAGCQARLGLYDKAARLGLYDKAEANFLTAINKLQRNERDGRLPFYRCNYANFLLINRQKYLRFANHSSPVKCRQVVETALNEAQKNRDEEDRAFMLARLYHHLAQSHYIERRFSPLAIPAIWAGLRTGCNAPRHHPLTKEALDLLAFYRDEANANPTDAPWIHSLSLLELLVLPVDLGQAVESEEVQLCIDRLVNLFQHQAEPREMASDCARLLCTYDQQLRSFPKLKHIPSCLSAFKELKDTGLKLWYRAEYESSIPRLQAHGLAAKNPEALFTQIEHVNNGDLETQWISFTNRLDVAVWYWAKNFLASNENRLLIAVDLTHSDVKLTECHLDSEKLRGLPHSRQARGRMDSDREALVTVAKPIAATAIAYKYDLMALYDGHAGFKEVIDRGTARKQLKDFVSHLNDLDWKKLLKLVRQPFS